MCGLEWGCAASGTDRRTPRTRQTRRNGSACRRRRAHNRPHAGYRPGRCGGGCGASVRARAGAPHRERLLEFVSVGVRDALLLHTQKFLLTRLNSCNSGTLVALARETAVVPTGKPEWARPAIVPE